MTRVGWIIPTAALLSILVLIAAVLIPPTLAGRSCGSGYGGMMGPWMMGGYGILGAVLGLLFLVLVVGGAAWLVVTLARGAGSGVAAPRGDTPLEILKRRYAAGELTREQ